jgi:hypothetical protein
MRVVGDGASDGTRTHGIQDHNLALYQLSYARHSRAGVLADRPGGVNASVCQTARTGLEADAGLLPSVSSVFLVDGSGRCMVKLLGRGGAGPGAAPVRQPCDVGRFLMQPVAMVGCYRQRRLTKSNNSDPRSRCERVRCSACRSREIPRRIYWGHYERAQPTPVA